MATFKLYGGLFDDLFDARHAVEKALVIKFEERDSSYHGRYFLYGNTAGGHLIIKNNVDPIDGCSVEEVAVGYPILLYVNEAESVPMFRDELVEQIGFHQIRCESF